MIATQDDLADQPWQQRMTASGGGETMAVTSPATAPLFKSSKRSIGSGHSTNNRASVQFAGESGKETAASNTTSPKHDGSLILTDTISDRPGSVVSSGSENDAPGPRNRFNCPARSNTLSAALVEDEMTSEPSRCPSATSAKCPSRVSFGAGGGASDSDEEGHIYSDNSDNKSKSSRGGNGKFRCMARQCTMKEEDEDGGSVSSESEGSSSSNDETKSESGSPGHETSEGAGNEDAPKKRQKQKKIHTAPASTCKAEPENSKIVDLGDGKTLKCKSDADMDTINGTPTLSLL
jgi:hypothetical protein